MKDKINVAELLRNCPKGMELDCTMFDNVHLERVDKNVEYPIAIRIGEKDVKHLTKEGCWNKYSNAKCVIFPKGKTTWEGFQRPFKDGDVITCTNSCCTFTSIFKEGPIEKSFIRYCTLILDDNEFKVGCSLADFYNPRFATEEEKQKLFASIKAHGYKWNPETKTLEELIEPKFNVGDRIKRSGDTRLTTIKDIRDDYYIITIPNFFNNAYITDKLLFINQSEYEIVPYKFDIATLKPFDKVLVRGDVGQKWTHDFFGFMDKDKGFPFVCVGHYVIQCIPYEGNEHLIGKTDDCDEYFKTWK